MAGLLEKTEKSRIISSVGKKGLNRRQFVAAATAAVGVLALAGCNNALEEAPPDASASVGGAGGLPEGGEWKMASCFGSCTSRCFNPVYVVDGVPIRQKSDDSHKDSEDYPQQRGCVKGRANRQYVLGADRLKYPMKRKNWEPGSGGDVSLRGRDEWERISWEEALDFTAQEFQRIKDTYGNLAFLSPGLTSSRGAGMYSGVLLNAFGGATTIWGQQSKGGLPLVVNTIANGYCAGAGDRITLRKAKLIVLWGFNSIYSMGGTHTLYLRHAKDAGAKIITVDPWFSPTAQGLTDQWVPVRPGTDSALLCAIAYHMIDNGLQDQDYLDKYCIGFDADHMPEGEGGQENFKDYILGTYDNTPKTPEWASDICGTSPDAIRDLAEQMAGADLLTIKSAGAAARVDNGQQFAQMLYTVAWMTGCVGKEGGGVTAGVGHSCIQGGPALVSLGSSGLFTAPANPVCSPPRGGGNIELGEYDPNQYYGIAYVEVLDAIITGKHTDFTRGTHDCNIKCIYKSDNGAPMNQIMNLKRGVEALRMPGKIEFVVAAEYFLTTDAKFADIVFPIITPWEYEGGYADACNREAIVVAAKIIEPLFEAKTDWYLEQELAKRLGIDEKLVASEYQDWDYAMKVVHATLAEKDGSKTNLASITAEDITDLGLPPVVEPQEGKVPIKELYATGGYQVERSEGDGYDFTALASFYADPAANPVPTRTGKFEIFSRQLVERAANYNTTHLDPIGKYVPAREGYEASFTDWAAKTRGEYTFQMITLHLLRQAHSMYYNVKSLNEVFSNNAVINELDAAELGLKTNDTALITSIHGQVLRRILVSPRIMPGVCIMGQGTWIDLDEETQIDKGANVNYLSGDVLTGEGQSPYNTVLLKIERWTGTPLEPDYMVPQRVLNL